MTNVCNPHQNGTTNLTGKTICLLFSWRFHIAAKGRKTPVLIQGLLSVSVVCGDFIIYIKSNNSPMVKYIYANSE